MNKTIIFLLIFICVFGTRSHADPFKTQFSPEPKHTVLLIVDGLSYKAWDRMNLPILKQMTSGGVRVEQLFLPPAAHPKAGEYAELHSGSIPNPIMMSGTVFITHQTKYIQDFFLSIENCGICRKQPFLQYADRQLSLCLSEGWQRRVEYRNGAQVNR